MSETKKGPGSPLKTQESDWPRDLLDAQIRNFSERVTKERFDQDEMWGAQNIPDLQPRSDGTHQVGRSYRMMETIMKYQCDRAAADGHRSMDLVLLEEVFEALAAVVAIGEERDPIAREARMVHAIKELVQVAAVSTKWGAMIERDEPRHG